MLTFPEGLRPTDEVLQIFADKGYDIDKEKWEAGGDFIYVFDHKNGRRIYWNQFNYRFFVTDGTRNILATESSINMEKEEWYVDLLRILFRGEPVEDGKTEVGQ